MKKMLKKLMMTMTFLSVIGGIQISTIVHAEGIVSKTGIFSEAMGKSVSDISTHLDIPEQSKMGGTYSVNYITEKIMDVVFPVMIVIGVLVAMVGLYQILFSSDEGKIKNGAITLVSGVIGIIIMYSANFISKEVFDTLNPNVGDQVTVSMIISNLYNSIVYPFIKIAIYLSLGFLVVLMMRRVFTYITAQDDSTKKKAIGVISWTTIGMLFILAAKQIVEAVYGKQEKILNDNSNLANIGTRMLDPEQIPIVYNVINWSLGLISLALLVIIIFQTYKMLTKPDDATTFTSLKKTIIYALLGLLLIGSAYILANLFIIS